MVGFFFRNKIFKFYYATTPYETRFTKMILRKSIYERNFTKEYLGKIFINDSFKYTLQKTPKIIITFAVNLVFSQIFFGKILREKLKIGFLNIIFKKFKIQYKYKNKFLSSPYFYSKLPYFDDFWKNPLLIHFVKNTFIRSSFVRNSHVRNSYVRTVAKHYFRRKN